MRVGSLCSGYGGLDQAVQAVIPADLVFVADPDPGASKILTHHHSDVPNLGDITRLAWSTVPQVDILTAGFPYQDISNAGKRAGIEGTRSGIWAHVVEAVRVVRPRLVFLENVSALTSRGLDRVAADLAEIGFVGSWRCVRASDVGAPHRRERIFILAWPAHAQGPRVAGPRLRGGGPPTDPAHLGHERPGGARVGWPGPAHSSQSAAYASGDRRDEGRTEPAGEQWGSDAAVSGRPDWGPYGPAIHRWGRAVGRVAPVPTEPGRTGQPRLSPAFVEWLMGLPEGHVTDPAIGLSRNQQLKALGNGVVPQQGAHALRMLLERASVSVAA